MSKQYVVLDLETTGLDPGKNLVLEIGALHIDMKTLDVLSRFHVVAGIPQVKFDVLQLGNDVKKMHTANGLFEEVVSNPPCDMFCLDSKLSEWFQGIPAGVQEIVLCGNSIHFDRGFLEVWMLRSFAVLSHRVVDTSSILSCYKEWCGEDMRHTSAHRAIADCEASLEVLRWAKKLFTFGRAAENTVSLFQAMAPGVLT